MLDVRRSKGSAFLQLDSLSEPEPRPGNEGSAGFTLVEVIAALAILSLSLSVLFGTLSGAFHQQHRASDLAARASLAQSIMARLGSGIPLEIGSRSGAFDGRYEWTLRIAPYASSVSSSVPVTPVEVSLEVSVAGQKAQPLVLKTLRLLPKRGGE